VNVFGLAVHFNQLSLEVEANLFEHDLKPLDGVPVQYLCSILCDKDQVNM
jgi:hypothetical protein